MKKVNHDFTDIKVLIIGDIMTDAYLIGEVNRLSPEAPVPIVDITHRDYRPGGAANVALNVASLGASPILLSVVGDDDNGKALLKLLRENKINTHYILTEAERITTVKTRVFDEDKQVLRYDEETDDDITRETEEELISMLTEALRKQKVDVIIIQDYNKGVLTKRFIKQILLLATKNGVKVAVDPKQEHFYEYQQVDLFKPNIKELSEALDTRLDPRKLEVIKRAAEELKRKNRYRNLMLTMGAHGIFITNSEGEMFVSPARQIKAADVSGAGDTVISVAALAMVKGYSMKQIGVLCNKAAAAVCKKVGVAPVLLKEL